MASKRRPIHTNSPIQTNSSSRLNFRANTDKNDTRGQGTKPTPDKPSVKNILLMMLQHLCRRLLFFDTKWRVALYMGFIFIFSVLVDVLPLPRGLADLAVASKHNFLNTYFVKIGWGWTLLLGIPFNILTSFIYCCGRRENILKHATRLFIATFFWYFWTNMYNYVESVFGRCTVKDAKFQSKPTCIGKGYYWQSVDISGHIFILLYSTLTLIEESRVINSWEGISDLIREEEHARGTEGSSSITSPLRNLSADEFEKLKSAYPKLTPYIRGLFILITGLVVLWDMMLITTVLFFHNMIEKFLAAVTAIATWYVTYYIWYSYPKFLPSKPGEGLFKYEGKQQTIPLKKRQPTTNKVPGPKFMGMPLKVPAEKPTTSNTDEN